MKRLSAGCCLSMCAWICVWSVRKEKKKQWFYLWNKRESRVKSEMPSSWHYCMVHLHILRQPIGKASPEISSHLGFDCIWYRWHCCCCWRCSCNFIGSRCHCFVQTQIRVMRMPCNNEGTSKNKSKRNATKNAAAPWCVYTAQRTRFHFLYRSISKT